MPTIISGLDPSVRMNAYLAGQKFQTQIQEQQAEEQREAQRQRQEFMRTMQSFRAQQAKALEDVNARAQMGDALAMQQQNIEAQAAGLPPEQKRLGEMAGVLSKITDPKARALAIQDFQGYDERLRAQQQRDAAMKFLEKRIQDGKLDPEQAQLRMQAGEEPEQIAKEEQAAERKEAAAAVAMQENQEFAARAEQLLQSAPKGTKSARRAGFALQKYMNSPTDQQSPGSGAALLKTVQDALILEEGEVEMVREQAEARHKKKEQELSPKYWDELSKGAPVKPGGPFVSPAAGSGSAKQSTQKSLRRIGKGGAVKAPAKSIGDIATSIPDPRSGALELEKQGYDLGDPEVQRAIREAYAPVQR